MRGYFVMPRSSTRCANRLHSARNETSYICEWKIIYFYISKSGSWEIIVRSRWPLRHLKNWLID